MDIEKRKSCCSKQKFKTFFLGLFPFILHLKEYKWKTDFVRDAVSGLCSGVIHVPQGMGFALLANVPPIYGLYTSILPGWAYYIFGTSKHLSFGTMAVTALMVGGFVSSQIVSDSEVTIESSMNLTFYNESHSTMNYSMNSSEIESIRGSRDVDIASSLTFVSGLIQLLLALLNGGMLASFMSLPFISGFTTASAVHIMVTQTIFMLGIKVNRTNTIFQLPITIYRICAALPATNICSLISSVIICIFLIITKELINERFKSKMPIPIPSELLAVALATIVTKFAYLHERWGVDIVGSIPMGLPTPFVPSVLYSGSEMFFGMLVQAIPVAVVGFAFAVTMAKLMAERHDYEIRPNQELFACSCVNTLPAFFGCFAATQAPTRTMVHDSTGCRSQLAGLLSTLLPLLVILCFGPFLGHLPLNALGSVCFCALIPLLKEFRQIRSLWKASRLDCAVWSVSFLTTLLLSITYGLIIGVLTSCALVLTLLRKSNGQAEVQLMTHESRHVILFKVAESLCFLNVEVFKKSIRPYTKNNFFRHFAIEPKPANLDQLPSLFDDDDALKKSNQDNLTNAKIIMNPNKPAIKKPDTLYEVTTADSASLLCIDCSRINFIDSLGLTALRKCYAESKTNGVDLNLVSCSEYLTEKLKSTTADGDLIWKFYSSVDEAVKNSQTED